MHGCTTPSLLLRCAAFFLAVAAATFVWAESPDQTGTSTSEEAPSWQPGEIHLQSSRVYIHVGKTGLGHEHAIEGRLSSGELHLTDAAPSGELVFDMTSFSAETDAARRYIGLPGVTPQATRDGVNGNMLGPQVLNVRKYPTAKLEVTAVTPLSEASRRGLPQYKIEGRFTLHGTTRAIAFTADAESKDGWTHLRGGFAMLQSDFGITPFAMAFGTIGVTDKLTIWGDLWIAESAMTAAAESDASR